MTIRGASDELDAHRLRPHRPAHGRPDRAASSRTRRATRSRTATRSATSRSRRPARRPPTVEARRGPARDRRAAARGAARLLRRGRDGRPRRAELRRQGDRPDRDRRRRACAASAATIEATDDGFVVRGTGGLRGGTIASHGDHRLAMLGAVAGLASREGVEVDGHGRGGRQLPLVRGRHPLAGEVDRSGLGTVCYDRAGSRPARNESPSARRSPTAQGLARRAGTGRPRRAARAEAADVPAQTASGSR